MSSAATAADSVDLLPAAFWIHRGAPPTMQLPHRHDDVEINVVVEGRLDYLFGGSRLTVHAGQVAIFWAATPHRLLQPSGVDHDPTRGCWLHIPLSTVLGWRLPEQQIGQLLRMAPVLAPLDCLPQDPERLFDVWASELSGQQDASATIPSLLEIQALLRRVFRSASTSPEGSPDPAERSTGNLLSSVTAMAQYIVEHFREQISIEDIAAAAHLNRTYAATIFSRSLGTSPGRYLTRCRVAEAQRLLITTDLAMLEIAHRAGFSSQSSFYDQFTRRCSVSPGGYRRRHG